MNVTSFHVGENVIHKDANPEYPGNICTVTCVHQYADYQTLDIVGGGAEGVGLEFYRNVPAAEYQHIGFPEVGNPSAPVYSVDGIREEVFNWLAETITAALDMAIHNRTEYRDLFEKQAIVDLTGEKTAIKLFDGSVLLVTMEWYEEEGQISL